MLNPHEERITWNATKDSANQKKHRVTFKEAATVFYDPLSLTIEDSDHSVYERRLNIIGQSESGRLLVVTFTERLGELRIIRAQRPTPLERRVYEEGSN
jgi:uncharacterized protein